MVACPQLSVSLRQRADCDLLQHAPDSASVHPLALAISTNESVDGATGATALRPLPVLPTALLRCPIEPCDQPSCLPFCPSPYRNQNPTSAWRHFSAGAPTAQPSRQACAQPYVRPQMALCAFLAALGRGPPRHMWCGSLATRLPAPAVAAVPKRPPIAAVPAIT